MNYENVLILNFTVWNLCFSTQQTGRDLLNNVRPSIEFLAAADFTSFRA